MAGKLNLKPLAGSDSRAHAGRIAAVGDELHDIRASHLVRADAADLFAFLADLENHWAIAGRFVDVVDLTGPPRARTGGRVRIRGPLGLRRTAHTQVDYARPVEEMGGSARIGATTTARVQWRLRPQGDATAVTLAAKIEQTGRFDRLLLALGGRTWLRQRFKSTLQALEARLAADRL